MKHYPWVLWAKETMIANPGTPIPYNNKVQFLFFFSTFFFNTSLDLSSTFSFPLPLFFFLRVNGCLMRVSAIEHSPINPEGKHGNNRHGPCKWWSALHHSPNGSRDSSGFLAENRGGTKLTCRWGNWRLLGNSAQHLKKKIPKVLGKEEKKKTLR